MVALSSFCHPPPFPPILPHCLCHAVVAVWILPSVHLSSSNMALATSAYLLIWCTSSHTALYEGPLHFEGPQPRAWYQLHCGHICIHDWSLHDDHCCGVYDAKLVMYADCTKDNWLLNPHMHTLWQPAVSVSIIVNLLCWLVGLMMGLEPYQAASI